MTRILLILLVCAIGACTAKNKAHRTLPPTDEICGQTIALGATNLEPVRADNNPSRCFLQTHQMPVLPKAASDEDTWAKLAADAGRTLTTPQQFKLAFVEMGDNETYLMRPQLDAVQAQLVDSRAKGRQNYVIAFVHGWRHDASLRDNDVRKFRILLGYARSALNARCVAQGEYCNADLTGVFIGWRGRAFPEPLLTNDGKVSPFSVMAAPTFWGRKSKSEALGGEGALLEDVLTSVQSSLRLDPGRVSADKFLIVGHSLGGNMLATLMESRARKTIEDHFKAGHGAGRRPLAPPLGDLVVLLNPASEASKWAALQNQVRARSDLPPTANALTATGANGETDPALAAKLRNWRQTFPVTQRPVYIAVTSTNDWSGIEREDRKIAYDTSTGFLFPLAQRFAGVTDPTRRQAIGHLAPEYESQEQLKSPAIGSTHEISVNKGTGTKASYQQSGRPDEAWCDPATGWLTTVRQQQADQQEQQQQEQMYAQKRLDTDGWDYGLSRDEQENRLKAAANIARGRNEASVQWRHSHYLRNQPDRWSIASGRSPFWNVRALDTALRDHAGWVNYPMWCALNQLVLDDVTSDGRAAPVVEKIQKAEQVIERIEQQKSQAAPAAVKGKLEKN